MYPRTFLEIASRITINCDQNTKRTPPRDYGEHDKVNKVFQLRLSRFLKFTNAHFLSDMIN